MDQIQPTQVLTRNIEFRKATKLDPNDILRSTLIPLNKVDSQMQFLRKSALTAEPAVEDVEESIRPKQWLYERSRVNGLMHWPQRSCIGSGLQNLGNSCFMNAVLQCLAYIPPLRNFLASIHKEDTKRYQDLGGFDPLTALKSLFQEMSSANRQAVAPSYVFRNLKRLSRALRAGRQEDAQEFALHMLEACHDALLRSHGGKVDRQSAETTAIHQIFGGYLRSQVKWSRAEELKALAKLPKHLQAPSLGNTSDTFDPFLILSVEIKGDSIQKCLANFTQSESLSGSNKYKTPSGVYVEATKQFTIHQAPPVLVIHFKRFNTFRFSSSFGGFGKIQKMVRYPQVLDMAPFCSAHCNKTPQLYKLIGVVVHDGSSPHSGHYYSFVRNSNQIWYLCDDSRVQQVGLDRVMCQMAYLLVYIRDVPLLAPNGQKPDPHAISSAVPAPTAPPAPQHEHNARSKSCPVLTHKDRERKVAGLSGTMTTSSSKSRLDSNGLHSSSQIKSMLNASTQPPQPPPPPSNPGTQNILPKKRKKRRSVCLTPLVGSAESIPPQSKEMDSLAIHPKKKPKEAKLWEHAHNQAIAQEHHKTPISLTNVEKGMPPPSAARPVTSTSIEQSLSSPTAPEPWDQASDLAARRAPVLAALAKRPGLERDAFQKQWDMELDQGRTRKVKKRKIHHFGESNPFQMAQDWKVSVPAS
eukprot:NODE_439_length_2235_cov_59.694972_g407_i0.p1 GENE.NODE_439_length_2235_cov_59.694972_g407_i0~~NODE_439_length_2235_cov_59.694972_g407_i0.p1  ORF type:complete len:694 (-),score=164.41 NODE_439_length_2235_cov_59.694972_g407_i0:102-2183(-)